MKQLPHVDERHREREVALQLLYQWEITGGGGVVPTVETYGSFETTPEKQRFIASALAKGTAAHLDVIDPLIAASTDHWRVSRMVVLDRMIMRLAVYEFLYAGTPRPVVIDEALELAKTFSSEEAVAFINGILDTIRRRLDDE